MNKLIFFLCLSFISLTSFKASAVGIDITITSNDGCKFHIKGEVSLSWTGSFQSFSGTVTASGDGDCPNGSWTFGMAVDNNGDPEEEGYRFSGNSPFIDVLKKEPKTLKKLVTEMES